MPEPDLARELTRRGGAPISEAVLAGWMSRQRWFGAKARELAQFHVLDVVLLDAGPPPLAVMIVEARMRTGVHELYQLPIGARSEREDWQAGRIASAEDTTYYDALADPQLTRVLARLIAEAGAVPGEHATIRFSWHGEHALGSAPAVRALQAEQSNSSLTFDDRLVLKVFRRIEPGSNPELEMLSFLAAHDFPSIAALAGSYDYRGELLETTLGVMQEFIADAVDGWTLATRSLREDRGERFLDHVGDLGAVTGRMHTVLGSDASDPDFAPEEPLGEHVALLSATIDEQIERIFLAVAEHPEHLEPLVGRGEQLRDRLSMLSHTGVGGRLIRSHGDYHLGQVLRTPTRWVIIDFEGEPSRPMRERRRKRSPLRDVAGMLRSLAYVGLAGELLGDVPAPPPEWEGRVRRRFLGGYMSEIDTTLLPAGQQAIEKLIAMFELEKALYELRYELNNRPSWVPVAVAGLTRLLEEDA
jgi:maltokinase